MKMPYVLSRSVLLSAILAVSTGCGPSASETTPVERAPNAEDAGEQRMERKTPPFFIYRPGAGLTIEGSEGEWKIRL